MNLWISDNQSFPVLDGRLQALRQTPSLTALAMQEVDRKTLDSVVLDCRGECPYSDAHILSAQSFFQIAGVKFYVICKDKTFPQSSGIFLCDTPEAVIRQLQDKPAHQERTPEPSSKPVPLRPISVSVMGSQSRIGCTTQALQLWHYFSSLHYKPVVIFDANRLEQLKATDDDVKVTREATFIEGIPFLSADMDTGAFNCMIRDWGVIDDHKGAAAADADLCVMVAGVKPWEFTDSAAAISRLSKDARLIVVVSFGNGQKSIQDMGAILKQLKRSCLSLLAGYAPDPFQPGQMDSYQMLMPILQIGTLQKQNTEVKNDEKYKINREREPFETGSDEKAGQ